MKKFQQDQLAIELMIQSKVQEAADSTTRTLTAALENKLEHLGRDLLSQISSMARKRDAREDEEGASKLPRGTELERERNEEGMVCVTVAKGMLRLSRMRLRRRPMTQTLMRMS